MALPMPALADISECELGDGELGNRQLGDGLLGDGFLGDGEPGGGELGDTAAVVLVDQPQAISSASSFA